MTNPFENTRPPFLPDPTGLSGSQRRSSYASVAAGAAQSHDSTRGAGPFSYILHPTDGAAPAADGNHRNPSARNHTTDMADNGLQQDGGTAGARMYQARNQQLPSFSRSFEMFISRGAPVPLEASLVPGSGGSPDSFFVPSYLRGSGYMAKLEEAHKKKQLALKEAAQNTQGHAGALPSSGSGISLHGSKLTPPSYRGMTHEVIEKPPVFEDDDSISPVPTCWNKDDKFPGLEVLAGGQEVKYSGVTNSNERDHDACSIRADHPMPVQCGLYYYEVTILSKRREETTIGIGFSSKNVVLSRAPGWEAESWGYHGDDGHSYAAQNVGKRYADTFTTGDTIGCGVNFRTGVAFFTKNGRDLGTAFREIKGKLYPSVGLKKSGEHIRVNFGQTPFVFDIDGYMKREVQRLKREILGADTSRLAPPLKETELVQQLVLQFLQHDGYIDTARAFAEEVQAEKQHLSLDPNEIIEGINITDDEDASKRQRIRRAVLEGDIDKALKYTNAYYPQVLKENEQVYFRLKCRKFIEMTRKEAEMNLKQSTGNGHSSSLPDGDIDMDDLMPAWQKMDTDSAPQDLTLETLQYGQTLRAEFHGDQRREVTKALDEIFSLMAYPNPLKEKEVAHLLDRKGRVAVAEELNSAILQHFGKSSRSALENLYAQTSVLLDDISEKGGPGAFVSIQSIIDEIPKTQPF